MKKRILLFGFSICFFSTLQTIAQSWHLYSPDNKIRVTVELKQPNRNLVYYVDYIENSVSEHVINESELGVRRMDELFANNFSFEGISTRSIDENYQKATGKKLSLRNNANEMKLSFKVNNKLIDVVFRAYNDGVGFRYVFPETSGAEYYVTGENTTFQLPTNGTSWLQEYSNFHPVYERFFNDTPMNQGVGSHSVFPALFKTSKFWVLLTESDLQDNFFASHIDTYAGNGTYRLAPPAQEDGNGFPSFAKSTLPWVMPWRVIIIGTENKTIVESDLVSHLSSPSTIADISWIKPGLSAWSWWSNLYSPTDFVALRNFIDFTATFELPYFLVDLKWNNMGNGGNIDDIISHANSKNVKLWLWYNSGGPTNDFYEDQPRDLMHIREIRRNEFQRIKNLGIKGVKIDFFQSDKQEVIKQYIDIFKDAADYQLMVNVHGSTVPKGWERTYPNLVAMEAVKGAEAYLFDGDNFRPKAATHHTILPFTRNAIGAMDYTPVIIGEGRGVVHYTTDVHEIALLNTFESGQAHLVDRAESYLGLPAIAQKMIRQFPTTWDETHLIDGFPGTHVIMARRKGENWYISGINGENSDRAVNLNFPLIANGDYTKLVLKDGTTPRDIVSSETDAVVQTNFNINEVMKPNGGFLIILNRKACQTSYILSNNTLDVKDEYKVSNKIESSVKIAPNRKVNYDAGKSIDLKSGFEVKPGATFTAKMGGCTD